MCVRVCGARECELAEGRTVQLVRLSQKRLNVEVFQLVPTAFVCVRACVCVCVRESGLHEVFQPVPTTMAFKVRREFLL